ncbi:hypothetical protein LTR08_007667 [Meristemomyces frigidus]|nr:hypothetical protein LTR08_007667 [Meristemomyces frigidus]
MSASTWWWPWAIPRPKPKPTTDAAHDPAIRAHFISLLDNTEPPASFKARDVAELLTDAELFALGYDTGADALPAIIELAFELREFGDCEIMKQGKVLGAHVTAFDIKGGIRVRRVAAMGFEERSVLDDFLE